MLLACAALAVGDAVGKARAAGAGHRRAAGGGVLPRLQRVRVDDHVPGLALRHRRVGERPADRRRVVGGVALAEVVEDELAALGPEALLQPGEELGAPRLVTAALPEELALERVQGVDVRARPRLRRALRRPQLGVDALHVGVDVVEQPPPARARRADDARLARDLGLGLRARRERPDRGDQPDGAQVRRVDGREPGVVARLLEQEPTVLGDDPARRPRERVVRLGGDVRDVELVAHEAHAAARDLLHAARALPLGAEALGLEVAVHVVARDLVEPRRQRVVHARLAVGAVGDRERPRAGRTG